MDSGPMADNRHIDSKGSCIYYDRVIYCKTPVFRKAHFFQQPPLGICTLIRSSQYWVQFPIPLLLSMVEERPPMPFYPPKGSKSSGDSIITQSFKRTDPNDINGSTKVQISIIRGSATAEEVLRTIHEFKQAILIMGWTTG